MASKGAIAPADEHDDVPPAPAFEVHARPASVAARLTIDAKAIVMEPAVGDATKRQIIGSSGAHESSSVTGAEGLVVAADAVM